MEKNFRVTYEGNCGKAYTTVTAKDNAEARKKFLAKHPGAKIILSQQG